MGGAKNCLNIAIADKRLYVFPIFPFNLMFLPEIYNLEHVIPLDQIESVELKKGVVGNSLELTFQSNGKTKAIKLRLKKIEEFINVLQNYGI